MRANCPNRNDSEEDKPVISEFKKWQGNNQRGNVNDKRGRKGVSALCCHVRGVPVASTSSTKTSTGVETEWVLDSASDVHVCKKSSVLHNVRMDNVHFFQGYDGKASENEQVGDVTLRAKNNKPHTQSQCCHSKVSFSRNLPRATC